MLDFDPDAYRARLDQALASSGVSSVDAGLGNDGGDVGGDDAGGGVPSGSQLPSPQAGDQSAPPQGGDQGGNIQLASNSGGTGFGIQPSQIGARNYQQQGMDRMMNRRTMEMGRGGAGQFKGKTQSLPPNFTLDVSPDKMKDIHSAEDLWDAVPDKQKNQLVDYYEKQLGSIRQHYDDLRQQVPQLPEQGTKQEKLGLLFQFGLNLMRNSASDRYGKDLSSALATSTYDTFNNYAQQRSNQIAQRQQMFNDLDRRQQGEERQLGTLPQIVNAQANINRERREAAPKSQLIYTDKGQVYSFPGGGGNTATQIVDVNTGQPLAATRGPRGSGHDSVFMEKLMQWKQANPIGEDASESEKADWNNNALKFASGQTGLTQDRAFQNAMKEARLQIGNPENFISQDGSSYVDAVNARALDIYSSTSARSPMRPPRKGQLPEPSSKFGGSSGSDPLGLR